MRCSHTVGTSLHHLLFFKWHFQFNRHKFAKRFDFDRVAFSSGKLFFQRFSNQLCWEQVSQDGNNLPFAKLLNWMQDPGKAAAMCKAYGVPPWDGWEAGAWTTSGYPYVLSPVELPCLWAELAVANAEDFRGEKKTLSVWAWLHVQHCNFPLYHPSLEVTERRITLRLEWLPVQDGDL